ncbi:FxSxx-COOH system tetratricopeptide repeat protein [Streptomyces sp. NBC_00140]|uniref:FxSxx-COOH system tetratricopeptide repeat protein n=1 Tax=Streptomyces sp. NBC_00140 TaxID=2975664 RepID=UPI0022569B44|nr:FxSxx-COOH system tetratricopeptide repeat protein [Streptomyces sp. NBC_00140]MCX5332314.1 FxSxx-COOH system tetratricopeptide repeat protein [Streptomyces sp. NBC_00140]
MPTSTELADALYLAAWQDYMVPRFDAPGRDALERRERLRRARRRRAERATSGNRSDPRTGQEPADEQSGRATVARAAAGEDQPADLRPAPDPPPPWQPPPSRPQHTPASRPWTDPGQAEWPASPPLADALALGRSLRPLRLTRSSLHEVVLDEEATAEQAATAGIWTPVCRSVPERRLDLLLVVDASDSMVLWSPVTRQIAALMEQTAAFRTVRLTRWDPDTDAGTGFPASEVRSTDQQLLLIITDGGHRAWRTGSAAATLHRLARHSPVAVLSLLPQQLWDLTLPTITRTRLRASSPAAPNRTYDADWKHPHTDPPDPRSHAADEIGRESTAIPVPVIELRPGALSRWAHLVAAADGEWHALATLWTAPEGDLRSAVLGPTTGELATLVAEPYSDQPDGTLATESPGTLRAKRAAAVVRRFRATASPAAYELAKRLAAAPLNLPVMRLLQQSLPAAECWNLAEIMLLGLVRHMDESADAEDVHRVSFDYLEGVREELLALGSRAETLRALRQVQQHLGPRLEALWGEPARALVATDGDHTDPPMTEQTRPFVKHLYTALCSVSGPYLERANCLGRLLEHSAPGRGSQLADGTPPAPGHTVQPQYPSLEMRSKLNIVPKDRLHGTPPPQAPEATNTRHPEGTSTSASAPTPDSPTPPSLRQGGIPVSAGPTTASGPRHPHTSPRIWGNVPQRNRNFTGRETLLERLNDRLRSGVAAVLPEALHGMGGVGKSQIAVEYVYRHNREYRLVWWIPSEQESQIIQSLVELGEQMGLQAGPEISAVPAVLDALRRGEPYDEWLLVFDNAEDPRTVRKYFPSDGPGSIVVTSRNSQWSNDLSSLEVDVFARAESVALLRRRSPDLPDEAVDHLAAALGDLPLAVEQAAVWLAETGMPVQQYLEVYERNFTELMQSAPPSDYNRSVAAAWNVSLGRLRETRPDALQLLQVCAFFAPEPIDWDLFSAVRGISVPPELQSALEDPVKLGRAVREIGRYALARIDHRQNTLLMHRLVQRVLVEQMNPQEQAMMRHAAHQLLSHADPRNPERPVSWPRYSSLLSHLRASKAVKCEDGWTRQLVLNEVRFLRARGDHAAALELGEQAAAIWRAALGDDHEDVLSVDQQIAETLREQGTDLGRAYTMQSGLVERYRRVLGEEHEDSLRAQSYMAIHHRNRGHFEEAREMDQRVYDASTREFGEEDPATLLAAHNYAVSLRLAGDSEQALELDYNTWQSRIEILGEDHRQTLGTREAYLLDLQEVGRYAEANDGYATLAQEATGRLGEQHPFVALVIRNWCVTLRKMGDHQRAYELSSTYLKLIADTLGTDSRYYLLIAVSHANDLRQVGKLRESRALTEQVLAMSRERYGREHPHSYAIAMNLAVTLRLLGKLEDALALNEESVEGLTRVLGQGHPRTVLARMNLASDYFALGRFEEAHDLDKAVAEESERLRENHPANLAVRLNLSYDLKSLRRTEESERLYVATLDRYSAVLGPSHPATLNAEKRLRANGDTDLLSL